MRRLGRSHSEEVIVHFGKLCRRRVKPALGPKDHCVGAEDVFTEFGDPGVDAYDGLRVVS